MTITLAAMATQPKAKTPIMIKKMPLIRKQLKMAINKINSNKTVELLGRSRPPARNPQMSTSQR